MTTALAVFTRDLRLADNAALTAAVSTSEQVIPCFVVDDEVLARCQDHATRLAFLTDSLRDLDNGLRAAGTPLVVRRGSWTEQVLDLGRTAGATAIHVADDYSWYARRRLAALEHAASAHRICVTRHAGVTLIEPGRLAPAGKSCYQVFGPYYQRWRAAAVAPVLPVPARIRAPAGVDPGRIPRLAQLTRQRPAAGRPAGGETAGLGRLRAWAHAGLAGYQGGRDDLAGAGTSRLSPYLHLGCVSARTVAAELAGLPGSEPYLRQLAWRDFFHQMLAVRPDGSWRDLRPRGDQWHDDPAALAAWQAGKTGYPIVDAAMRQLAAEGYLHNRARMIVASFLTKDLYLDWRHGARHFMRLLADGDVACNQLNWQWVAGTGTDTSPHRMFSPTRQGRRFDPGGDFVRQHVPELAALPAQAIHDPDPAVRRACRYPDPIVDHRTAAAEYRARVMAGRPRRGP